MAHNGAAGTEPSVRRFPTGRLYGRRSMITRTLFFSNPGHLSVKMEQLVYTPPREMGGEARTFPIEDLGFVIIENQQMILTAYALDALARNNTAVILCDQTHTPASQLLPFSGHTLTQKHFAAQAAATETLKGRLWKQTVRAKIKNQAACLARGGKEGAQRLRLHAEAVKNGDQTNREGVAAKEYWAGHTPNAAAFKRDPDGGGLNGPLNYGYAILRAATARALAGSGLSCLIGLHHHNQYNAFTLADDVMEPYRPFVDDIVMNDATLFPGGANELTKDRKAALLGVLTADVIQGELRRPLMNALSVTTASLAHCFLKEETEIACPSFP